MIFTVGNLRSSREKMPLSVCLPVRVGSAVHLVEPIADDVAPLGRCRVARLGVAAICRSRSALGVPPSADRGRQPSACLDDARGPFDVIETVAVEPALGAHRERRCRLSGVVVGRSRPLRADAIFRRAAFQRREQAGARCGGRVRGGVRPRVRDVRSDRRRPGEREREDQPDAIRRGILTVSAGPRSSDGQSAGLLIRWSQVRILPGASR